MSVPANPRHDLPVEVVERAMDRAAGSRPIPGNRVGILFDGPEVYPAMLDRIAAATRWIHFDNYIIRGDTTGRRFADALIERAAAGVKVRVLTDWIGSFSTRRRYWRAMREAGVEIRFFNPPRFFELRQNLVRDHRKLLVVDGATAVTGGLCIGDEWSGRPEENRLPWRDTGCAIDGPAAAAMDHAFASLWGRLGAPLGDDELAGDVASQGGTALRVISGEPGGVRAARATELLLAGAAERIWITDAYLVAPRGIYQGLLDAARDGVDVRVLVPGSSDLPHVRNLTRLSYRDLLAAGVRIFEWRGAMLHAKTIVSDARWVRIGSSNLNLSSLIANYEIDVLAEDPTLAHAMEVQYRRDIDQSVEIKFKVRGAKPRRGFSAHHPVAEPSTSSAHRRHHPGLRERRRGAVVALWGLFTGARRTLYLQYSLALTVLGVLFLFFPRTMAGVFAGLSLYLATAAWLGSRNPPRP
ncbi:MAG: cardiolipin synthase B [Gemmatimonadales bacterium]|nr:cardiolipin synthase B [Gemmatimonadales bacterium]